MTEIRRTIVTTLPKMGNERRDVMAKKPKKASAILYDRYYRGKPTERGIAEYF
jgi:hypothetical protein